MIYIYTRLLGFVELNIGQELDAASIEADNDHAQQNEDGGYRWQESRECIELFYDSNINNNNNDNNNNDNDNDNDNDDNNNSNNNDNDNDNDKDNDSNNNNDNINTNTNANTNNNSINNNMCRNGGSI